MRSMGVHYADPREPAGKEDALFIGEGQLAERSSVKDLEEVVKYFKLTASRSKATIFNRIRDS